MKAVEPAAAAVAQRTELGLRVSNRRYEGVLRICGAAGDWAAVNRLSQLMRVRSTGCEAALSRSAASDAGGSRLNPHLSDCHGIEAPPSRPWQPYGMLFSRCPVHLLS